MKNILVFFLTPVGLWNLKEAVPEAILICCNLGEQDVLRALQQHCRLRLASSNHSRTKPPLVSL